MSTPKTIVRQSAVARNGLFIMLEAAFVIAFLRGVRGAATTGGAIAAAVFTTACAVGISLLWIRASQQRSVLEISNDAITLQSHRRGTVSTMSRRNGDEVRFVMRGGYRYRNLGLVQLDTNSVIMLPWYSRKPIEQACAACGWRVGNARSA